MQFWQCSISLQFLQIITAKDFAFGSLQNLQLLTSADCSVSLHAMVHCNSKCIAVIPLQFHGNSTVIVCSVLNTEPTVPYSSLETVFFSNFITNFLLCEDKKFDQPMVCDYHHVSTNQNQEFFFFT